MNDPIQIQSELERLRTRQSELEFGLTQLRRQIEDLAASLEAKPTVIAQPALNAEQLAIAPLIIVPLPVAEPAQPPIQEVISAAQPPPLPQVAQPTEQPLSVMPVAVPAEPAPALPILEAAVEPFASKISTVVLEHQAIEQPESTSVVSQPVVAMGETPSPSLVTVSAASSVTEDASLSHFAQVPGRKPPPLPFVAKPEPATSDKDLVIIQAQPAPPPQCLEAAAKLDAPPSFNQPVALPARPVDPVLEPEPDKVEFLKTGDVTGEILTPEPVLPAVPAPSVAKEKASFEMRLGTYWLVRIGVVMLLTGLVFLGTYAYKNYIDKAGPGGKVALLYVASGLLLGVGRWLEKREKKQSLKNYAQVLFAGGLAAVYFTTYAAHYYSGN